MNVITPVQTPEAAEVYKKYLTKLDDRCGPHGRLGVIAQHHRDRLTESPSGLDSRGEALERRSPGRERGVIDGPMRDEDDGLSRRILRKRLGAIEQDAGDERMLIERARHRDRRASLHPLERELVMVHRAAVHHVARVGSGHAREPGAQDL